MRFVFTERPGEGTNITLTPEEMRVKFSKSHSEEWRERAKTFLTTVPPVSQSFRGKLWESEDGQFHITASNNSKVVKFTFP